MRDRPTTTNAQAVPDSSVRADIGARTALSLGAREEPDSAEPSCGSRSRSASQSPARTRRFLVISEHKMYRAGLAAMLERMGDYESRESSTEPAQLIATLQDAPVLAALVVAVDLPQLVPLVQLLRSQQAKLSIILVSDDDESPVQVTEGVRLGASAILDTDSSPREFRAAAASVAAGGLFIARTCVERIGVRRVPLRPAAPSATVLSPRQREVLAMVADGMTSAEIASALHVSPRTVDSHRLAISKRLGIRNVADLLRYAIRERLVST